MTDSVTIEHSFQANPRVFLDRYLGAAKKLFVKHYSDATTNNQNKDWDEVFKWVSKFLNHTAEWIESDGVEKAWPFFVLYVAVKEGTVIGALMMSCHNHKDKARCIFHCKEMVVAKEHRQNRVCTQMMEASLDFCTECNGTLHAERLSMIASETPYVARVARRVGYQGLPWKRMKYVFGEYMLKEEEVDEYLYWCPDKEDMTRHRRESMDALRKQRRDEAEKNKQEALVTGERIRVSVGNTHRCLGEHYFRQGTSQFHEVTNGRCRCGQPLKNGCLKKALKFVLAKGCDSTNCKGRIIRPAPNAFDSSHEYRRFMDTWQHKGCAWNDKAEHVDYYYCEDCGLDFCPACYACKKREREEKPAEESDARPVNRPKTRRFLIRIQREINGDTGKDEFELLSV